MTNHVVISTISYIGAHCHPSWFLTSPNRAGVAEPHLKMWGKNVGQNLGLTDGWTDRQTRRVTLQLKIIPIIKHKIFAFEYKASIQI